MPFPDFTLNRRAFLTSAALAPLALRMAHAQEVPVDNPQVPDQAAREAETWHHSTALTGTPKYPEGFAQFGYVNAAAPKGGRVRLAADQAKQGSEVDQCDDQPGHPLAYRGLRAHAWAGAVKVSRRLRRSPMNCISVSPNTATA